MLIETLALLLQSAVAPWSPPVQADWPDDEPLRATARLSAPVAKVSMRDHVPLLVSLSARDQELKVSPFINATRGIAFEVVGQDGRVVAPQVPIAISPPAPPLALDRLKPVGQATPMVVGTGEQAINLFPGPGRYRVRAIIFFMEFPAQVVRYTQLRTQQVTITVTP